MSEFKEQIERAARRQRIFLVLFVGIGIGLLLIAAFLFVTVKVTALRVAPLDAAKVAVVAVDKGVAFYFQGSLFSLSRYPVVTARATGFATAEKVIEPEEEGEAVTIVLKELPARLEVSLANPAGDAAWFVNGKAFPPGENFSAELAAGHYTLRVEHPYLMPLEKEYDLKRGAAESDNLILDRATGRIHLDAAPAGAIVRFDGKKIEALPAELEREAGKYEVEVTKDGYAPVHDNIELTYKNSEIERHYRLQKKPAYALITVSPKGGQLTLNGKSVAANMKLQVSAGQKYYLKYAKDGYGAREQEFTLAPDEMRRVSLDLKLKIGEVHVLSFPDGEVFIDGRPAGTTPLRVRLPAVAHEFAVRRPGYVETKKTVRPDPTATREIEFTLKTQKEAILDAAKPVYINSAGMEMHLFEPTALTLGAPRNEKGQRANEFLRKVTLTRHFYAGDTEVTEAQYSQFKLIHKLGANFPVTGISWDDAAKFCNWLSEREGLPPFYRFSGATYRGFDPRSDGYRLLTEAEWEWLARKAGRVKETIFPWGDDAVIPKGAGNIADETANGKSVSFVPGYVDSFAAVAPAGSFGADRSGLHDLFGNVAEWVHDFYNLVPPPSGAVYTDPLGDSSGDKHVIKGASFASGTLTELRPAYRAASDAGNDRTGFRIGRYLYGVAMK